MSIKDVQVVSRYSGSHNFYKLCFSGELTDPFGEKNGYKEVQKSSDFEEFLSFTWDVDDGSVSSISDDEFNKIARKEFKSALDNNYSSFSDSDSDSESNTRRKNINDM